MAESRFERWSRLKREARAETIEEVTKPDAETEEARQEQELQEELALNEQLSDEELLAKYDLPNPDVVELGMDIKGFLRSEIPEALRRRALRSLWRSNPVLAVLDGLNDYDEDFNAVTTGAGGVKTLYQVGKGMFDKVKRAEEKLAQMAAESSEIQSIEESVSNPVKVPDISELVETPDDDTKFAAQLPERSQAPLAQLGSESSDEEVYAEEPVEPSAFRYRPRMSFE